METREGGRKHRLRERMGEEPLPSDAINQIELPLPSAVVVKLSKLASSHQVVTTIKAPS